MGNFSKVVDYTVIGSSCGCPDFAVPTTMYNHWREKQVWWSCPYCKQGWHFTGETKEQRQLRIAKDDLRIARNEANQANQQLSAVRVEANTISAQYKRMKKRIRNGVCPCCNRTFTNLGDHMRTQHADFSTGKQLKILRETFGLTQITLAEEISVKTGHISAYERGQPLISWASESIDRWVNTQVG